jgi:hypothetical protein
MFNLEIKHTKAYNLLAVVCVKNNFLLGFICGK